MKLTKPGDVKFGDYVYCKRPKNSACNHDKYMDPVHLMTGGPVVGRVEYYFGPNPTSEGYLVVIKVLYVFNKQDAPSINKIASVDTNQIYYVGDNELQMLAAITEIEEDV